MGGERVAAAEINNIGDRINTARNFIGTGSINAGDQRKIEEAVDDNFDTEV